MVSLRTERVELRLRLHMLAADVRGWRTEYAALAKTSLKRPRLSDEYRSIDKKAFHACFWSLLVVVRIVVQWKYCTTRGP